MPWGDAGIQELPLLWDRDPGLSSMMLIVVSKQGRHLLEAGCILPSTAWSTQYEGVSGAAWLANLWPSSLAAFVRSNINLIFFLTGTLMRLESLKAATGQLHCIASGHSPLQESGVHGNVHGYTGPALYSTTPSGCPE
jgi:hypothetical protein